jgi:hypothetical protein
VTHYHDGAVLIAIQDSINNVNRAQAAVAGQDRHRSFVLIGLNVSFAGRGVAFADKRQKLSALYRASE